MMSPKSQKRLWWLVLAAGCGMIKLIVFFMIQVLAEEKHIDPPYNSWIMVLLMLAANAFFAAAAVNRLKKLYKEHPENWTGQWQIQLNELMAIVTMMALTLWLCSAARQHDFLRLWVPLTFKLWMLYVFALFLVRRMGEESVLRRWYKAFWCMLASIVVMYVGVVLEVILVACVLGPLVAAFARL